MTLLSHFSRWNSLVAWGLSIHYDIFWYLEHVWNLYLLIMYPAALESIILSLETVGYCLPAANFGPFLWVDGPIFAWMM